MAALADDALTAFVADLRSRPAPAPDAAGPGELRRAARERAVARPPGPPMHEVADVEVPAGPPVRVYRPSGAERGVVVWCHGGGWVLGDVGTHDRACRRLAGRSGLAVVSVDYRRAPEHPWPAAVADTVAVVRWARSWPAVLGTAAARVAVGGDSAGGLLAALACLRLRPDPAARPDAQLLVYANTDLAAEGGSMDDERGYGLEPADVRWFNRQWVPDERRWAHPGVSPLRAPDLAGLPPAVVVTCEHDPLRDQGEAYAARLAAAGVPTTLRREPGMVHNFLLWDLVSPACAAAGDRVADDAVRVLRTGGRR